MRRTIYIGGSYQEALQAACAAGATHLNAVSSPLQLVGLRRDHLVELVGTFWQRPMRDIEEYLDGIQRFDNRGLPEGANSNARAPRLRF